LPPAHFDPTGAQWIVRLLEQHGVTCVAGVPGGAVLRDADRGAGCGKRGDDRVRAGWRLHCGRTFVRYL
jgi:hypothetical protein